jgi:hypothetical protein
MNNYLSVRFSFPAVLSLAIFCFSAFFALDCRAQFNYQSANAQILQGTYTDLGTCGTVIDRTYLDFPIEYDDTVSKVYNIGFNFVYNGTTHTQFILSTNGFIKLGNTPPGAINYDFINGPDINVLAPFNLDLEGAVNPEYRYCVSGTAPNRICTIQFKNLRDILGLSNQYSNLSFQIKLYETTNNIDFVYGTVTPTSDSATVIPVKVGIKGSSSAFTVNVAKKSFIPWASATFIDGPYVSDNFNIRNSVLPVSGLTYRFIAQSLVANDARVSYAFALADIPAGYGFPQVIKGQVRNTGSLTLSNLPVYLNVTGANNFRDTQIVSSLAPGAAIDVNFDPVSSASEGLNDITVSVPNDGNNNNNSASFRQRITEGLYGYPNNAAVLNYVGFGNSGGILLNRHQMTGTALITSVRAYISNDPNNIGKGVFGAVCDAAGVLIGRSPDLFLTAADLNKYIEFKITPPVSLTNAEFYAGLGQNSSIFSFFPLGIQDEGNLPRSGAYYSTLVGGGPLVESNNTGRYMIQAIINYAPLPQTDANAFICPNGNKLLVATSQGSTYQWQVNTGSGFVDIANNSNYSGATNDSLLISNIPSSWYGYQYACKVNGVLGPVTLIKVRSTWTGQLGSSWETAGNWSCGVLPDANTDVYIPTGTPACILTSERPARTISVQPSSIVRVQPGGRLNLSR